MGVQRIVTPGTEEEVRPYFKHPLNFRLGKYLEFKFLRIYVLMTLTLSGNFAKDAVRWGTLTNGRLWSGAFLNTGRHEHADKKTATPCHASLRPTCSPGRCRLLHGRCVHWYASKIATCWSYFNLSQRKTGRCLGCYREPRMTHRP